MSENSLSYDQSRLVVTVGLILLSLDSVANQFENLGLSFVRPELVKDAARRVVGWLTQFPEGTQKPEAMIGRLVDALEKAGDADDAKRAAAWLTRLVSVRRCEDLAQYWGPVLLLFSPEYATVLRQLGMREDSVSLLERLSDEWGDRLSEIESLADSLERSVESDWDRARYREYQRESDLVSPVQFLTTWLRAEGFLEILRVIAERLEPQELTLLEAWGKATAAVQTTIAETSLSLENINEILSSCSGE